jgi:hypothetical protein
MQGDDGVVLAQKAHFHAIRRGTLGLRKTQQTHGNTSSIKGMNQASRRQSTIFMREARQAGMKPPTKPMASEKASVLPMMSGVRRN